VSDRGVSGAALEKTCVLPKSSLHINNDGETVISGAVIRQKRDGRKQMVGSGRCVARRSVLLQSVNRTCRLISAALAVMGVCAAANTAAPQSPLPEPEEEYGEFLARPEELASVAVNDIVKSLRLTGGAMSLGKKVYDKNCAICHGADLKGIPDQHTPDLTDADWRFSGDDLASGGNVKFPSDVEWTVRYGIRSDNPNARGLEADMLAYDPQYRTEEDTKEFGDARFLTDEEIEDVVEYVLQISGQQADAARAARGNALFLDGTKGNCFDCHGVDATGSDPIGSTNLTRKDLYLWGSDRASILQSITRGRRGVMPAFEGTLKPEEVKAVSVYVFSRARR
jgi:cytochrome c oxidase cbb3-type subunit III